MPKVTINCDMGESFGIYRLGSDEAIMPFVTHANVACGFHASDPVVMRKTVRAAKEHGLLVGVHPGLRDPEGFGRREMRLRRDEVSALVLYQTGALRAFVVAEGMELSHIKPHGALMGMAGHTPEVAEGIADAALAARLPVIVSCNSGMIPVLASRGVRYVTEFVADLEYDDQGHEIITMQHDAVDPRHAAERALRAVTDRVARSVNGRDFPAAIDSICLHSDTPGAADVAKAVRGALAPHL